MRCALLPGNFPNEGEGLGVGGMNQTPFYRNIFLMIRKRF